MIQRITRWLFPLLVFAISAAAIPPFGDVTAPWGAAGGGRCVAATITSATSSPLPLLPLGHGVAIQFDADADGSETGATVSLDACTRDDANSCEDYQWDTNADGLPDNSQLDGVTVNKRGLQSSGVAGWLEVTIDVAPSATANAEIIVCDVD